MAAVIGLAAVGLAATISLATAQTCKSLWYQRNAIYKNAGYCFKTARGVREFGNAGCAYGEANAPLSPGQRARIASIARSEQALGCR
jgi:hypothetical protein